MNASTRIAVVTGANRGIGAQLVVDLVARGFTVVAAARDPASVAVRDSVIAVRLDVESDEDAAALAARVDALGGCDTLINNAGIYPRAEDGDDDGGGDSRRVPLTLMRQAFEVNTLGPLRVTQALQGALLRRRGAVVNVSSGMGQLHDMGGGSLPYRTSKTALHAVTVGLADAFKADGVVVNAACPGWVRTDMGGQSAPRSPEQGSASVLAAAFLDVDQSTRPSGGLYRDGKKLPW